MTVCLVIPTMNEIQGLRVLLPKVAKDLVTRVVILDGGSKDGSIEYVRSLGLDLVIQSRPGMKMAYQECYPHIKEDIVITFSPDGNSKLEAIQELIEMIRNGYDMVIASRYKGGARSYDDTRLTRLGNMLFTKLISIFGYPYTDAMVMYRAYSRELPRILGLNIIRSPLWEKFIGRYVSWEPLMSIRAAKLKLRIAEIPADEPKRFDESSNNLFLPTSRIHHYKAAMACFLQLLEELVFWRFSSEKQ